MKLMLLRSMWCAPTDLQVLVEQTRAWTFDGIEGPIPRDAAERRRFAGLLRDAGLSYIAEATTGLRPGGDADWWVPHPAATVQDHLDDLQWSLEHASELSARFVTTMCGYDAWSLPQNVDFFSRAMELGEQAGMTLSFETHRCRSLYSPWVTRDILQQVPGMRLTCDLSHWCVVAERLIDTEGDVLDLVVERAEHVQCRVGWAQGAQVSDPFAPEHARAVAAHERWWDRIWDAQAADGRPVTTMTAEWGSGAEGYLPALPYTRQPVADLMEITRRFGLRQRDRFAARRA